ncbi:MAG: helix-turn-helix domain-containing protein [Nitrospinota bacterium]
MEPRLIKTEEDHKAFLAEVERLVALDPAPNTPEGDRLELLATLVENYEKEHFPIEKPTPIEAILVRMEEQGLKQKDLVPYIGSESRVSEILNGKRGLTLQMIRALSQGLGIPLEVLMNEPGVEKQESRRGDGSVGITKKVKVEMHTGEEHEFSTVTNIEEERYKYKIYQDRKVLAVLDKGDVKNLITKDEDPELNN